jgi:hypothetical protein
VSVRGRVRGRGRVCGAHCERVPLPTNCAIKGN